MRATAEWMGWMHSRLKLRIAFLLGVPCRVLRFVSGVGEGQSRTEMAQFSVNFRYLLTPVGILKLLITVNCVSCRVLPLNSVNYSPVVRGHFPLAWRPRIRAVPLPRLHSVLGYQPRPEFGIP